MYPSLQSGATPPGALPPAVELLSPRDTAVVFFRPMAEKLSEGGDSGPIVFPRFWPSSLRGALRRPLERTALTLGADLVRANRGGCALVPRTFLPPDPRSGPLGSPSPRRAHSFELPGGLPPDYGAGAFRPGVALLIGDRSNVARIGQLKHRLPFVTFAGSGIAPWLARQLDDANVGEDRLYWINAYDAVGNATSPQVIPALRPRIVVSLGKLADRWVSDAGAIGQGYEVASLVSPGDWRMSRGHFSRYPLGVLLSEVFGGTS